MKKSILTLSIIALSLCVKAQTKQTSSKQDPLKVPFNQSDLQYQANTLQWLAKTLHGLKMDALVRDTADNKLGQMFQLIQVRYREAFVADSLSKVKVKKP